MTLNLEMVLLPQHLGFEVCATVLVNQNSLEEQNHQVVCWLVFVNFTQAETHPGRGTVN